MEEGGKEGGGRGRKGGNDGGGFIFFGVVEERNYRWERKWLFFVFSF